jgi:DNA repair exonuclease SbcCD nuclease subunit
MTALFWQNLFSYTEQMVSMSISRLARIAPVYIYMVPGNHDNNSTFSLGEVLRARFAGIDHVHIDNTPIQRKYHRYGNTLLGYVHGNEGKKNDLYSMMALDRPEDFGRTKYRHYRVGHLHKNARSVMMKIDMKDEQGGVELEICPSLSPVDEWHYKNLYIGNLRRSKAFIHDPEKGCVRELYYNL